MHSRVSKIQPELGQIILAGRAYQIQISHADIRVRIQQCLKSILVHGHAQFEQRAKIRYDAIQAIHVDSADPGHYAQTVAEIILPTNEILVFEVATNVVLVPL